MLTLSADCILAMQFVFSPVSRVLHMWNTGTGYKALKAVCKYLCLTKDWGIIYKCPEPLVDLPDVEFDFLTSDPELPLFP